MSNAQMSFEEVVKEVYRAAHQGRVYRAADGTVKIADTRPQALASGDALSIEDIRVVIDEAIRDFAEREIARLQSFPFTQRADEPDR